MVHCVVINLDWQTSCAADIPLFVGTVDIMSANWRTDDEVRTDDMLALAM